MDAVDVALVLVATSTVDPGQARILFRPWPYSAAIPVFSPNQKPLILWVGHGLKQRRVAFHLALSGPRGTGLFADPQDFSILRDSRFCNLRRNAFCEPIFTSVLLVSTQLPVLGFISG